VDPPYVLLRGGRLKGAKAKRAILFDGLGITKSKLPAAHIAGPQFDNKYLKFIKFFRRKR
jgi:hypothetical protein